MTKKDLIDNVCVNSNFQRKEAAEMVETFFDLLKDTLAAGEEVKVSGFGKFVISKKHDRKGRNPQTGELLTITSRKVVSFKPSAILKQSLNPD